MIYFIPVYQVELENQQLFLAFLRTGISNVDYPTRIEILDWIDSQLAAERKNVNYPYEKSRLKLFYDHYSNGEFYLWDQTTQPSFEKPLAKITAQKLLASEPFRTLRVNKGFGNIDLSHAYFCEFNPDQRQPGS